MKKEVQRLSVRSYRHGGEPKRVFLRTASIEVAQEVFVETRWAVYLRVGDAELIADVPGSPKPGREEEAARFFAECIMSGMGDT